MCLHVARRASIPSWRYGMNNPMGKSFDELAGNQSCRCASICSKHVSLDDSVLVDTLQNIA